MVTKNVELRLFIFTAPGLMTSLKKKKKKKKKMGRFFNFVTFKFLQDCKC